jgi:hypothetical protein
VTIKSNALRRDGQSADIDNNKTQFLEEKIISNDQGGSNFSSLSNNSKLTSGESATNNSTDFPSVDGVLVINALKLAAAMDRFICSSFFCKFLI